MNFNVIYSYDIISETAYLIQKQENWKENEKIQALQFSQNWIRGMLNRAKLRRRKITTEEKKRPPIEDIKRILGEGQDIMIQKGFNYSQVYNMDETAVTYAIGPTHQYVPINQCRAASVAGTSEKLRITAIITVNANGEFTPLFLILKHSSNAISENKPDQSKMRVLDNLHTKLGYRKEDNWKLETWEKELELGGVKKTHICKYLINSVTGHVIASQHKAWNDQVRMIMWFDLVILPIKIIFGKMLLWVDNCGSHKTPLVRNYVIFHGIDVVYLPPNMTSELQVLDLVVNGPLKAHIRKLRAKRIVASFRNYLLEREKDDKIGSFEAPKPDIKEGVADLFNLFAVNFREEKFIEGVKNSFINSGTVFQLCEESNTLKFKEYIIENNCGSIPIIPLGCQKIIKKESDDPVIELENMNINDAVDFFDNLSDESETEEDLFEEVLD